MFAQKGPGFHGAPVLEREMRANHMLWGRANVMEETGEKVGFENRCEMWEVCLDDCMACMQSVHTVIYLHGLRQSSNITKRMLH
jgi:hypothetical protein